MCTRAFAAAEKRRMQMGEYNKLKNNYNNVVHPFGAEHVPAHERRDFVPKQESHREPETEQKTVKKPKPRPDLSSRKDVIWFPEYHGYSLRASVDNRFRIRYAPLPGEGSPWPMPQSYHSEAAFVYLINPFNLTFEVTGESCDILDFGIDRVRRNMFGQLNAADSEPYARLFQPFEKRLLHVNVTLFEPCERYPHLDMDEHCKSKGRSTFVWRRCNYLFPGRVRGSIKF